MTLLSADQENTLIDLIHQRFGPDLEFDRFAEVLLTWFEDIPGFDTLTPQQTSQTLNILWRHYHGQDAR